MTQPQAPTLAPSLAEIRERDASMHPSLWESLATITGHGGDIGEGNRAVFDRRLLLREVDRLLEAVRMAYEAIEGYWGADAPDSEATAQRLWFARGDLDRLLDEYEPAPPAPSR